MKKIYLMLLGLFSTVSLQAQILFNRDYQNLSSCNSISEIQNGSYLFTGRDTSGVINITKIDSIGDVVWSQNYGREGAISITRANNNKFLITGDAYPREAYILIVDTMGNYTDLSVNTSIGSSFSEQIAIQTLDNNYVMSAYDTFPTLIKFDNAGNEIWKKKYPFLSYSNFSFIETSDSGFIFVGDSTYDLSIVLCKTNSQGDTLWTNYFPSEFGAAAICINKCSDGGYIIAGTLESGIPDDPSHTWLLRFDSNNDTLWTSSYMGEYGNSKPTYIQQCNDGGYILTLDILSFTTFDNDTRVIKYDSSGILQWSVRFGGSVYGIWSNNSIQQTSDQGFIFANMDYFAGANVIKFDSIGNYVLEVEKVQVVSNLLLTPNPTTSLFTLRAGETKIESVAVYNMLGEEVMNVANIARGFNIAHGFNRGALSIDISQLPPGIYIVQASSKEKVWRGKVMKSAE